MRRHLLAFLLAAGTLAAGPARAGEAGPSLASAPIDAAVFRDGEVRRSEQRFGEWTLVCDAIERLNHRFCSLRSAGVRLGARDVALLVSSGDDGRPAALLRLPLGLSLPFGLMIEPLGLGAKAGRRVPIALCGTMDCEAVWTLTADEITALRTGGGLRLSVRGWRFSVAGGNMPAPTLAVIPAAGFAGAVTASVQ